MKHDNDKNYARKDWLEEPCEGCDWWKKSWFLNGKVPEEESWLEFVRGRYSSIYFEGHPGFRDMLQTIDDDSSTVERLFGCEKLDFAICYMELNDGDIEVEADCIVPLKESEWDIGWYIREYDEKLLDKDGNDIEYLIDFDHSSNNDLFRVPYTDLDINALSNGKVVLTKEAEEKWKKILAGEIPANQDAENRLTRMSDRLTDYFVVINENGTHRDVALWYSSISLGLYIKGDALESLKVLHETKFYLQTSDKFVKDFSRIEPSPKTQLIGSPQDFILEAGFCDIVSKREKGEDASGNFDADTDILDELLQD